MYIQLSSLKSIGNGVDLQVGVEYRKTQVQYILADVSHPDEVRYEFGYKNLATSQVFNGLTGVHFGRYSYKATSPAR